MKGGSPKNEKFFFAFLDELDHLEAKKINEMMELWIFFLTPSLSHHVSNTSLQGAWLGWGSAWRSLVSASEYLLDSFCGKVD